MRRLRFAHFAEDADEAEVVVVVLPRQPDVWCCLVCALENTDTEFCGWCSSRRGDWVCQPCAHKNPSTAKRCEQCGRLREAA